MLHAKIQIHRPSGSGEEDFLKVSAICSHGGRLGHVTLINYTIFHSLFLRMFHIKFGFDWPSGFREEDVFNIMVIHMYIAPGQGQTTLWAQNIFIIINLLLCICSFRASFLPLNDIFLFFSI